MKTKLKSIYEEIVETEFDTLDYIAERKLIDIFSPIIDMKDIEPDTYVKERKYSIQDKILLIKFIVATFSLESEYLKRNDTLLNTKNAVMEDLGFPPELYTEVIDYKIPSLVSAIQRYMERGEASHFREYITAKEIYERNLTASSNAVDSEGKPDPKAQSNYWDTAEKFKNKIHELEQAFVQKNVKYIEIKEDFLKTINSCQISDLIP